MTLENTQDTRSEQSATRDGGAAANLSREAHSMMSDYSSIANAGSSSSMQLPNLSIDGDIGKCGPTNKCGGMDGGKIPNQDGGLKENFTPGGKIPSQDGGLKENFDPNGDSGSSGDNEHDGEEGEGGDDKFGKFSKDEDGKWDKENGKLDKSQDGDEKPGKFDKENDGKWDIDGDDKFDKFDKSDKDPYGKFDKEWIGKDKDGSDYNQKLNKKDYMYEHGNKKSVDKDRELIEKKREYLRQQRYSL